MAYPDEHIATVAPKSADRFEDLSPRQQDEFAEGIDVVYGVRESGNTEVQSIRFDRRHFTESGARDWLKEYGYDGVDFEPAARSNPDREMPQRTLDALNSHAFIAHGPDERRNPGRYATASPATAFEEDLGQIAEEVYVRGSDDAMEDLQAGDVASAKEGDLRKQATERVEDFGHEPQDVDLLTAYEQGYQTVVQSRANPHAEGSFEEEYPGVFGDPDGDSVPTVDDAAPNDPHVDEQVEEVSLANEVRKIHDATRDYDQAREDVARGLRAMAADGLVKSRTKTPYSIVNKLRRKRLDTLTDLAGTMLIVPDKETLREVALDIEAGALGQVAEKENHYDNPGQYRAIHFILEREGVPVEVQLKTARQAALASAGHTSYKKGTQDADAFDRLARLADRADEGSEEAAEEIDPVLKNTQKLEARLDEELDAGDVEGSEEEGSSSVLEQIPGMGPRANPTTRYLTGTALAAGGVGVLAAARKSFEQYLSNQS